MVQQSMIMLFFVSNKFCSLGHVLTKLYAVCNKVYKNIVLCVKHIYMTCFFGPSLIISLKIRHSRLPRGINYLHTWTSGISENNGPALVRLLESYAP